MPTTVKIRRSGTASATPSALEHGEIAINYADGKVFWKNASDVITSFTFQSYALASHTHAASDITSGTLDASRLPLATTLAAGAVIVGTGLGVSSGTVRVTYGTTSGTACQGNDSRLSDARTPTSHSHGNITNAGAIGSTADQFVVTTTSGVLTAVSAATARTTLSVQPTASPAFTGSVGIGTSSPGGILEVNGGSGAATSLVKAASGQNAFLSIIGNNNAFLTSSFDLVQLSNNVAQVIQRANAALEIGTNGTTRLTISSTGTATFTGQILADDLTTSNSVVYGFDGDTNTGVGRAGADILTFVTNGSERVRVDASGYVIIPKSGSGTTGPELVLRNPASLATSNACRIAFLTDSGASVGGTPNGAIDCINTGGGGASSLTFSTWNGSAFGERVRVDASGNVGIGTSPAALSQLHQAGTYPTSSNATQVIRQSGTIPSGTTNEFIGVLSAPATQAASFTLPTLRHFHANPQAFGAGSTVTDQYGFVAESSLTGATNNYGFLSAIASGTNRWNFYASGSAKNYFNGETLIGSTTDNGAYLLQVNSQIYATNATIATSDARFKTNVESLADATSVIESLRPVAFDFIPQTDRNFAAERQVGLIAQEAQAALAGTDYTDSVVARCGDHLGLAYEKLVPVLIKALQESNARIAALEERLNG